MTHTSWPGNACAWGPGRAPLSNTTKPLCAAGLLTRRERASTCRQDACSARWVRRPTAHEAMWLCGTREIRRPAALSGAAALVGAIVLAAFASGAAGAAADDPVNQARKIREEVLQSSIKAPKDSPASRAELQRAMEHVKGLNPAPKPAPSPAASPALPPDVVEAAAESSALLDAKNLGLGGLGGLGKPVPPTIPDDVVEQLKKLPAEQVADLMALADALYLGGRQPEAFIFYEKALSSPLAPQAKAWALFQMANCRRRTDMAAAADLYKRLATEYPKCPWAGVAAVEQRLLAWYQASGLADGLAPVAIPAPPAAPAPPPSASAPAAPPVLRARILATTPDEPDDTAPAGPAAAKPSPGKKPKGS